MLEAPDDGLPLLATTEEDEWVTVTIDLDSIDKYKNAGPEKKWSCYRSDELEVNGEVCDLGEIPFWAMKSFHKAYDSLTKKEQRGVTKFEYIRTMSGKKNIGEFRV